MPDQDAYMRAAGAVAEIYAELFKMPLAQLTEWRLLELFAAAHALGTAAVQLHLDHPPTAPGKRILSVTLIINESDRPLSTPPAYYVIVTLPVHTDPAEALEMLHRTEVWKESPPPPPPYAEDVIAQAAKQASRTWNGY